MNFSKLPDNWNLANLADYLELIESGGRPKGGADRNGKIPSIGAEHLNDRGNFNFDSMKFIPIDYFKQMRKGRIQKEDVLVVKDGATTGKTSFVNKQFPFDESAVNEHVFIIRTNQNKLNPLYAFYFLYSDIGKIQILKDFRGSAQGGITKGFANRVKITLPPLPVQKKIAAILEKADAAREKRRQANQFTEQFLQSAFLEMFGDPTTNLKGWELLKLSTLGTLKRGRSKHRPRNAAKLLGGPYPLIQTGDVANSFGYIKEYKQTYSNVGLKQSKLWPKGTLCITIAANIAETGILTFDACFPDSIVGFVPNHRTNTAFIQQWFSFVQKNLEDTAPMSAQKNINLEILMNLEVPSPPFDLQQKFAAMVEKVEVLRTRQRQSEQELETLFNSLMQRAFRGELVPQDPNDEPASELLKRIKEERVAREAKVEAEKRKSKEKFLIK